MVKFVYSMLLIVMAGGVGLAVVCGWLNIKLYTLDKDKRRKPLGLFLLGTVAANGILVYALINAGTTDVGVISITFALARIISTFALAWFAASMIADLALMESVHNGHSGGTRLWLDNVERRLVAEEARNTAIEERADVAEERADAAEERETPSASE